ncbi:CHASE domain-containing protein [Caenimonas terrae]|uniref:histidine kinase n=1 Tax=Caenimonas terrae TaxID=696074 RepID=A0ABW0NBE0_9BURK
MNSSGGIRYFARFYAGAVLLAGSALAALTWYAVARGDSESRDREDEQRFAQLTYEVTSKVEQAYTMLRGVQGLFLASDNVTRADFHQYARALRVGEGAELQALQFARWVPQQERAAFEAAVRADASLQPGGYPEFRIVPPGERPFYVATEFNEPMQGNEAAFGFDTASGPVRAAVLEASRDTGEATASAPFTLVQTGKTGLVIRAPIYRRGATLRNVQDRRREYRGQVSVVFVADHLLGTALGHHLLPETEISLTDAGAVDGPAPGASGLLLLGRYGNLPARSPWREERTLAQVIAVHGRFWSIEMRSRPVDSLLHGKALTAGLLVLTLTLLVAGLLRRAIGQRDRAQARASAVLSATLTGIIAIDTAGLIRSANPAACSLFGHPEGELLGQPFSMLVPELARDGMPQVGTVRNVVGVTRDGQPLELAMSLGEVTGGGSPQLLASFHDISIEKRIQEQQRSFARELEGTVASRTADLTRVNQELEAFAYSVAHDLRAPVRHVHGFARVLELRHGAGMDDKARDYLGRIVAAAHGMGRLIDHLLAFSQLSHHELAVGPVDLNEVLRGCIDALAPELEGRAVEWRIGPLPVVQGDAALLAQVMSNLVGNAVKYSARSTPALIEVFSEDAGPDQDCIAIRDNGVGIDMQYVHRLFKVFSRLHHQDEFEGTGVGLANVRRIVERHGGKVWVESEPGAGACFRFTLPRRTGSV